MGCIEQHTRRSKTHIDQNASSLALLEIGVNPEPLQNCDGGSESISRNPCHYAQPFWAYEFPHRREIVPGAVFRKSPLPDFGSSSIVMTALRRN